MGFFSDFKKFAVKGNVIDLAVAVVIGAAFGAITKSLVDNIIMPPLGLLISGIDFSAMQWVLKEAVVENGEVVAEAVTMSYGNFIQAIVNFIIIALVIFIMIRNINKLREKEAAKPAPAVNKQEVLLAEIRDLLKGQNPSAASEPSNKVV